MVFSDWNELRNIAGKWKLYRIYWQRILIEQTSLSMVLHRIFLCNPTNLKGPKKHRGSFGYSATCPQPWSRKAANCKKIAWSLASLVICRSNLNWQIDDNYGKKLLYLKPPDSVQRPRVSRYGLKTLLCIFSNSSGVLHDRVSEMSLMATPYVKYHKLTKVSRNNCSHYDKTSENCGPLRFEENARKHTANQGNIKLLRLSPLTV